MPPSSTPESPLVQHLLNGIHHVAMKGTYLPPDSRHMAHALSISTLSVTPLPEGGQLGSLHVEAARFWSFPAMDPPQLVAL